MQDLRIRLTFRNLFFFFFFRFVSANGLAATYFNWRPNQPDNAGDKEDCIEVCPDVNDQWNDQDCQTSNPFACEMN